MTGIMISYEEAKQCVVAFKGWTSWVKACKDPRAAALMDFAVHNAKKTQARIAKRIELYDKSMYQALEPHLIDESELKETLSRIRKNGA